MKTYQFNRQSHLHDAGMYNDFCIVFENGNALTGKLRARTFPDPFRVSDRAPAENVFGCVAPGIYTARCIDDPKHGKCIMINQGEDVPSLWKDNNNGGKMFCCGVLCHKGWGPTWAGSEACQTLFDDWAEFIGHVNVGEACMVQIQDNYAPAGT